MRIKNWSEHQHYKNRNPPWIRLHKKLLDDPDFHELSGDDFKVLAMCWLIASEDKSMNGELPSIKKLAFRLRITEKELNSAISRLSEWICSDDSSVLANGLLGAEPETDNSETDNSETDSPFRAVDFLVSQGIEKKLAKEYLKVRKNKRLAPTETALSAIIKKIESTGMSTNKAIKICVENSWGGFDPSWVKNTSNKTESQLAYERLKGSIQ